MRALCLPPALLASFLSIAVALPAHAGRSLDEPAAVVKAAKATPRAVVDEALKDSALTDTCKDALAVSGLVGVQCRAVVAVHAARTKPLDKAADVDARHALVLDLEKSAASVRTFDPLEPAPGHTRAKFDAHRAISLGLARLYDQLSALPAASPAASRAAELRAAEKTALCNTVQASLDLAVGAGASVEERGALQGIVTSHKCFLDDSKLGVQPKPGGALKDNPDAAKASAGVGDAGVIRQYAEGRAIDMQRCTEKHLDLTGKPVDAKKLEECACGVVKRWKFPTRASETKATLPISAGRIDLDVVVAPTGTATTCGPLGVK